MTKNKTLPFVSNISPNIYAAMSNAHFFLMGDYYSNVEPMDSPVKNFASTNISPRYNVSSLKLTAVLHQSSERLSSFIYEYIFTYGIDSIYLLDKAGKQNILYTNLTNQLRQTLKSLKDFEQVLQKSIRDWLDYGNATIRASVDDLNRIELTNYSPFRLGLVENDRGEIFETYIKMPAQKKDDEVRYLLIKKEKSSYVTYEAMGERKTKIESFPIKNIFTARLNVSEGSRPFGVGKAVVCSNTLDTLNEVETNIFYCATLAVRPPLYVIDDSFSGQDIAMTPGAVNTLNKSAGNRLGGLGFGVMPNESVAAMSQLLTIKQSLTEEIRREYLLDDIETMRVKAETTATEINSSDAMRSGLIRYLTDELYTNLLFPLIRFVVWEIAKSDKQYSEIVKNEDYEIIISSMARAQLASKKTRNNAILANNVANYAQLDQRAILSFDGIKAIREDAANIGTSENILRTDLEIREMEKAINEAAKSQEENK